MAYNAAWFSLALVLTGVCAVVTFLAWRSRGLSALLTGAGITLLPLALWATGTLRLVAGILDQVAAWGSGFVFSPRVWTGLALGLVAVALIAAGVRVKRTRFARSGARRPAEAGGGRSESPAVAAPPAGRAPARQEAARGQSAPVDDDLADIEAILRKRGIS